MLDFIIDIFYAIMFISWWIAIIKYRKNVKSWTGNWLWAEKYIWNGGTYIVLIFTGLAMIFLWVLYPFGGMELITWGNTLNSITTQ
jgi:amino acid permease